MDPWDKLYLNPWCLQKPYISQSFYWPTQCWLTNPDRKLPWCPSPLQFISLTGSEWISEDLLGFCFFGVHFGSTLSLWQWTLEPPLVFHREYKQIYLYYWLRRVVVVPFLITRGLYRIYKDLLQLFAPLFWCGHGIHGFQLFQLLFMPYSRYQALSRRTLVPLKLINSRLVVNFTFCCKEKGSGPMEWIHGRPRIAVYGE